ncbi:MAG: hypothetical protein OJF50_005560 [Nitrospira sp.]|nr:hypothetical protein [Nitrospira sp.]
MRYGNLDWIKTEISKNISTRFGDFPPHACSPIWRYRSRAES